MNTVDKTVHAVNSLTKTEKNTNSNSSANAKKVLNNKVK